MYVRVTQFSIPSDKLNDFMAALNSAIPLVKQERGFHGLLLLRVEKSSPPDVRLMTFWETQQAMRDSEDNLYTDEVLARVLAFAQGFPVMREEEVILNDFAKAVAKAASS